MESRPDLLVSDAERAEAAAALRQHYESGRLTLEEFETRVREVHAARTAADLEAAFRQLPARRGPSLRLADRRWSSLALQYATLNAVAIAVWLASGAHGGFWPKWVLVGTLVLGLRRLGMLPRRQRRPARPPHVGAPPEGRERGADGSTETPRH